MRIKFQVLMILALLVSTTACENANEENQEGTAQTESNEAPSHNDIGVKLDNGKRWPANKETTEGMNNMIQIMDAFTDKENVDSYKTLTDDLNSEFSMIIQKCNMTGEAHNQLHNYILPMKDKFEKLSSSDLSECKAAFDDLKTHLSAYKAHFV